MIRDFPENTIVRLANSIGISLKKQGSSYMGRCPSCKDGIRTANTGYDPIRNIWHCFSCNAKGQLKDLCELEDHNFKECMNGIGIDLDCYIEKKNFNNLDFPDYTMSPQEYSISKKYVSKLDKPAMGDCNYITYDLDNDITEYFKSRSINPNAARGKMMQIKNIENLPNEFSKRLTTHKLVVPMYLPNGELYSVKFRKVSSPSKGEPKTLNKSGHGTCLIGWRNLDTIREKNEVIIVEGEIDYLTMLSAGFDNILALPSSTYQLRDDELSVLPENVILILDNDSAGDVSSKRIANSLSKGRDVYICNFQLGKDVNDIVSDLGGDYGIFQNLVNDQISRAKKERFSPFGAVAQRGRAMSRNIFSLVQEARKRGKTRPDLRIIPTGQPQIDEMLNGGLRDGLTGICGAPGVGKTTLFLAMAKTIVENNPDIYVVFISIEMTEDELTAQFLSWSTGISKRKILDNDIDQNGAEALQTANLDCYDRIIINDKARTIADIDRFVSDVMEDTGRRCVVMVDYLQQIKHRDPRMDERRAISENAYELKEIANTKKIPVVFISSTTRENYKNGELVGNALAAFKGSGDVEYSLYVGLYFSNLQKEEIDNYSLEKDKNGNVYENAFKAILVKNRHGSTRGDDGEYLDSTLSVSFTDGTIRQPKIKSYGNINRDLF